MSRFTQLVMGPAKVVGAPNQIHPVFQSIEMASGMTTFAGQGDTMPSVV